MDPDQALRDIVTAFEDYDVALSEAPRSVSASAVADAASDARDAFRSLHEWLASGGFAPAWADRVPVWTCPGCGRTINESDADMITEHVIECDGVNGSGQRV